MNPNFHHFLNFCLFSFLAWFSSDLLPDELSFVFYLLIAGALYSIIRAFWFSKENRAFIAGMGLRWTKDEFCRGWNIQGSTGSGKTSAAIAFLAHKLFRHSPNWGGVIFDPKCVLWITFQKISASYKRFKDFINLQVKPADAAPNWKPIHTINLLAYPHITVKTYARIAVDTAVALSGQDSNPFFKTQAERNIELGIRALQIASLPVTLARIFRIYTTDSEIKRLIEKLKKPSLLAGLPLLLKHSPDTHQVFVEATTMALDREEVSHDDIAELLCSDSDPEIVALRAVLWSKIPDEFYPEAKIVLDHFEQLLVTGLDQKSGVTGTLINYLRFFDQPEINDVFCAENPTVRFEDIDQGKFLCISIPQKYGAERDYLFTFLKLLYYTHALARFDYKHDKKRWNQKNVLVGFFDEAQGVATASEDGMADYNTLDKLREADCTAVFCAQSTTSYAPRMKSQDKVKVLLLNLKNQISFQIADIDAAKMAADAIGKRRIWKYSYRVSKLLEGDATKQEADEYWLRPEQLMVLPPNHAVIRHATGKFVQVVMPPLDESGDISSRYLDKIYS